MRVRSEHWQLLLDACEKNPSLITNKFNGPDGKAKGHILWENVTVQLNSLGFGEKSKEEWRKALTDWKSKTKSKATKLKQDNEKTGGGPPSSIPLSNLEKRLLSLMGSKAIVGDDVSELGFGKATTKAKAPVITEESNMEVEDECLSACPLENELFGVEHDYCFTLDTISSCILPSGSKETIVEENVSNCDKPPNRQKRKFSNTKRPIFNRVIRPRDAQRASNQLVDINKEALQLLRRINSNTESIAESLKMIALAMEKNK